MTRALGYQAGMPPLNYTMNGNDDAFLALLSSQRQLLNKLNMENAMIREQRNQQQLMMHMVATSPYRYMHYSRGPFLGADPFSLWNRPILERRSSLDMLMAAASTRRLSIGVGNDNYVDDDDLSVKFKGESSIVDGRVEKRMKRRRSSLGNLSVLLFEDLRAAASRRQSISSSLSKFGDVNVNAGKDIERFELEPSSFLYDAEDQQGNDELQSREQQDEERYSSPTVRLDPSIDIETLKTKIVNFASAMEKSSKTQQNIHDWDRKMGLKRSHSKTMRLSMRSRKKLRAVMKDEINTIKCATTQS